LEIKFPANELWGMHSNNTIALTAVVLSMYIASCKSLLSKHPGGGSRAILQVFGMKT
jgi:hypothetical protein